MLGPVLFGDHDYRQAAAFLGLSSDSAAFPWASAPAATHNALANPDSRKGPAAGLFQHLGKRIKQGRER